MRNSGREMIKKRSLYILKEKYLPPKILGHTKTVKTVLDKQGERCLPTALPQEAERGSSPLTAGGKQETGSRGIREAGNPARERGGGVLTLIGGWAVETGAGIPEC